MYQSPVTNLRNFLEDNTCIDYNNYLKNKHPRHDLTQTWVGVGGPYVQFGYGLLKIWCHNQGQVSVLMNADPINMIPTSQQSTKEGLNEELEGYFYQAKQSIEENIYEHPTGTLTTKFNKPVGGGEGGVIFMV